MRELKFRAWSPSENKMYYSKLVAPDYEKHGLVSWVAEYEFGISPLTGGVILLLPVDYPVTNAIDGRVLRLEKRMMPVKDAEIMEFAGILDKHGVEIYEGDIVEFEKEKWLIKFGEHDVPVDYHDGSAYGFYMDTLIIRPVINERPVLPFMRERIIVIGNRFQHPELLNAN